MDTTKCCIRDCEGKVRNSGFCNHHYMQWNRHGHPLADEMSHRKTGHRERNGRTYRSWIAMKKRCTDPKSVGWKYYGGKGITIHPRWAKTFINFLEDMGECPEGCSIERIDGNGNYEPGNCRWATQIEQSQNKSNITLTELAVLEARELFEKGSSIPDLVERYGVKYHAMYQAVKGLSWRHLNEKRS